MTEQPTMHQLISEIGAATRARDPERIKRAAAAYDARKIQEVIEQHAANLDPADRERLVALLAGPAVQA